MPTTVRSGFASMIASISAPRLWMHRLHAPSRPASRMSTSTPFAGSAAPEAPRCTLVAPATASSKEMALARPSKWPVTWSRILASLGMTPRFAQDLPLCGHVAPIHGFMPSDSDRSSTACAGPAPGAAAAPSRGP